MPVCDSAFITLSIAYNKQQAELLQAGKLIELRTQQRDSKFQEVIVWEERFNNHEETNKTKVKEAKWKGRKEGALWLAILELLLLALFVI